MHWFTRAPIDLGFLPDLIRDNDPRPVREQLAGGWNPIHGHNFDPKTTALKYPGDPALYPIAISKLRDEDIYFYKHDRLVVVQPDGSYEVSRSDQWQAKRERYDRFRETELGQLYHAHHNALVNYWRNDANDSISNKRLDELNKAALAATTAFREKLMEIAGV